MPVGESFQREQSWGNSGGSTVQLLLTQNRNEDLLSWLTDGLPTTFLTDVTLAIWRPGSTTVVSSDETTRNRVVGFGCLQDTFLAAYVSALMDDGLLSLGAPVATYLGDVGDISPNILVSHLLSKSSGIWPSESVALSTSTTWTDFCRNAKPTSTRFPPGLVVTHSIFERVLLLELVRRIVGESPYGAIVRRLFHRSADALTQRPSGAFSECYSEMQGTMDDLVTFLHKADQSSWWDLIGRAAGSVPLYETRCPKSWAATSMGLGLFQLGNGLWGQDGDAYGSFLGLRLCPTTRTAVAGIFGTPFARDHVLGRTCADLFGLASPQRDGRLGTLNRLDAGSLRGEYQGMGSMRLSVEYDGVQLNFPTQNTRMNLPADIHPDGSLTARWAGPTFWLEPRALPGGLAIRFSRHIFLKEDSDLA